MLFLGPVPNIKVPPPPFGRNIAYEMNNHYNISATTANNVLTFQRHAIVIVGNLYYKLNSKIEQKMHEPINHKFPTNGGMLIVSYSYLTLSVYALGIYCILENILTKRVNEKHKIAITNLESSFEYSLEDETNLSICLLDFSKDVTNSFRVLTGYNCTGSFVNSTGVKGPITQYLHKNKYTRITKEDDTPDGYKIKIKISHEHAVGIYYPEMYSHKLIASSRFDMLLIYDDFRYFEDLKKYSHKLPVNMSSFMETHHKRPMIQCTKYVIHNEFTKKFQLNYSENKDIASEAVFVKNIIKMTNFEMLNHRVYIDQVWLEPINNMDGIMEYYKSYKMFYKEHATVFSRYSNKKNLEQNGNLVQRDLVLLVSSKLSLGDREDVFKNVVVVSNLKYQKLFYRYISEHNYLIDLYLTMLKDEDIKSVLYVPTENASYHYSIAISF